MEKERGGRKGKGGGKRDSYSERNDAHAHIQLSEVAQCKSDLHVLLQGFLLVP